jgi:hypothetical protein
MKHYAFSTDPKDIWGEPLSKGYGPPATVDNLLARINDIERAHLQITARLVAQVEALEKANGLLRSKLVWVTGEVPGVQAALDEWQGYIDGATTITPDYGQADDAQQARERGGNPDRP